MTIALSARDIFNTSLDNIWFLTPGDYTVTFDDGVVLETDERAIIFDRHIWNMYTLTPDLPIVSTTSLISILGNGFYNGNTHIKQMNEIFKYICKSLNLRKYEDKEPWLKLARDTNMILFNRLLLNLAEHYMFINAEDILEVLELPGIVEAHQNLVESPDGVDRAYKQMTHEFMTTTVDNPIILANRCGGMSMSQTHQGLGPRGYVSDLDFSVFGKVIARGYMTGYRLLRELLMDSRTAARALNASGTSIQKAEYTSRRWQIQTGVITTAWYGDCGSTDYLVKFISDKKELDLFEGKWCIDPKTGEEFALDPSMTHLIGKDLHFKSVFTCRLPNRAHVCTKCLGLIAEDFKENSNLAYVFIAPYNKKVSQNVLSFKHRVQSVSDAGIQLEGNGLKYFRIENNNKLFFNFELNAEHLSVVLDTGKLYKLVDAMSTNTDNVNVSKIGELEHIMIQDDKTGYREVVMISEGERCSILTKKFFDYIKTSNYTVDEKSRYVIPLAGWDCDQAMFEVPLKEEDVTKHITAISELVEGTTTKKLPFYDQFWKLFDVTSNIAPTNIITLELLFYSISAYNPADGNYRLARNAPVMQYANKSDIFRNRSMSQLLIYENQTNSINRRPEVIFDNRYRQSHPQDVLFLPQKIVDNYNEKKLKH